MCVCVCVCEALQNKGTVYCANLLNKVNNKDIKNLGHTVLLYLSKSLLIPVQMNMCHHAWASALSRGGGEMDLIKWLMVPIVNISCRKEYQMLVSGLLDPYFGHHFPCWREVRCVVIGWRRIEREDGLRGSRKWNSWKVFLADGF